MIFNILFFLFLLSLLFSIVFLISPQLLKKFLKQQALSRKRLALWIIGYLLLLFVAMVFTASPVKETKPRERKEQVQAQIPTQKANPTPSQKTQPTATALTPTGTYHLPALDISGYPGLNKVLINASITPNADGIIFTNNEKQQWNFCVAIINPDSSPSNWYEYDFGSIPAGQSYTVQWSQLSRMDGTVYTNYSNEAKIIELNCDLDANTTGFARFHY